MYTIQHNPARLQLQRNRLHYCTAQTHENIRTERQESDIFCPIRRTGISCDSLHVFESNWTLHSSVTCISKKNMKQELMNGTPPGSIHACHPSVWIESEIFSQWFLHFIKPTKPTNDPVILVLDGHYPYTRNPEVITLPRENQVDIICLPTSQQPQNTTFG